MKHLTLSLFLILIFNYGFAQTKIIAFKSHSGNPVDFDATLENDNFGDFPEMHMIKIFDTVKVISDSQFVEVWHHQYLGTIEDTSRKYFYNRDTNIISPNYRVDTKIIKKNYPSTTVFKHYEAKKHINKKSRTKTNNLWLLYLILGGSLTPFVLQYFKKPETKN
jgi:hypothetical protein